MPSLMSSSSHCRVNLTVPVEDTPVKMVIMGDAYLQREKTDKPNRFVCLIGEKGKVLLTFFTEQ